jgi:pimeloyl-ACP methyl ester carboxylesterase
MRTTKSVAFAGWMLEHLTFGSHNKALAGDLLEEFHSGRPTIWYWRQVLAAIVIRALQAMRASAALLVFSAAWTMLYPVWRFIVRDLSMNATPDRWPLLAWPYSSLAQICYGVVPGVAFVWVGFMVYLLLRREVTGYGLILGLSQSLAVLLVGTIILFQYLKDPNVDLAYVTRDDFYLTFHLCNVSIPLALSLLAALFTLPRTRRISRTRRNSGDSITNRIRRVIRGVCLTLFLPLSAAAQTNNPPANVQFVAVDHDVRLEVLDWGGTGRPLIFLAGLGNDAHVFDKFAPKFTANYHVYGITRRGFGGSSKPAPANGNYSADRLGDDVLAVIEVLKLDQPVLAGHSLAGEELSSIGSRHPERVAGLIYLEAGYGYAFYDRIHGDTIFDFFRLQKRIDDFMSGSVNDPHQFFEDFSSNVSRLDKDLQEAEKRDPSVPGFHAPRGPTPPIIKAINLGAQEYTKIPVPVLAIFACPRNFDFDPSLRNDPKAKATAIADNLFYTSRQADAFAAGVPSAHVVRLPNADHYVFRSNEADIIREMNAFLAKLP